MFIVIFFNACDKFKNNDTDWPQSEDGLYFPPLNSSTWQTIAMDSLGWNKNELPELLNLLEQGDTRAFIVLKNGKIVIEEYWGKDLLGQEFDKNSTWYWASAGKTLTSFLIGQAQEDGFLNIDERSSKYLGEGWTSLNKTDEDKIKIIHQLTMTTGLDDGGLNFDCTNPECLTLKAAPGNRWSYHNAPYTLLDGIITGATNQTFESYFNKRLRDPIGMKGFWNYLDFNHIYFSDARSMARFGLTVLNNGKWEDQIILDDEDYLEKATNSSQNLNPSYGYLWWLNGKEKIIYPGLQLSFNKNLTENAPKDMFAAMGKNGQLLNIVPSMNIIVVRLGDNPDISLVPVNYQNDIWEILNKIITE